VGEKITSLGEKMHGVIQEVYVDTPEEDLPSFEDNITTLTTQGAGRRAKAMAAVSIIRSIAPEGLNEKITDIFNYDSAELPIPQEQFKFTGKLDSGGINYVFLLKSQEPASESYVLKIPIVNPPNPIEYAQAQKREFDEIKGYFEHIPNFVPEEHHMVVHSPRGATPTAAVLQEFIGGEIKDVFIDYNKDELTQLFETHPDVLQAAKAFIDTVYDSPNLINNELDLMGVRNLSIIETATGPRIVLLDAHYRSEQLRSPETKRQLEERCEYLRNVIYKHTPR
jgi:hypothetical protein